MIGLIIDVDSGDLLIQGGTLAMGETSQQAIEQQAIEHIIRAGRGEFREVPLIGAEVARMRHGPGSRLWCASAKDMCRAAGIPVNRVSIEDESTIKVE